MSDPLYKRELLRLAADATGAGRIPTAHATGSARNPACGDKITVDIMVDDGHIVGMAHDTKACVLTQASAAILGAEICGMSHLEVVALHDSVGAMLRGGEAPPAPFDCYGAFDGVTGHSNRHRCVLLPIEAVLAAFAALEPERP